MSQKARELFISPGVKTAYIFYTMDEVQGQVARDGLTLADAVIIAAELPCDATLPQLQWPGRANETIRTNLPG
jgi:hypothetical protein